MSIFRKITAADEFTGWHMAGVLGLFFGTIISVNMALAYFAVTSWSGLVVKNSYVESQRFNTVTAERVKSAQLGWISKIAYRDGIVSLSLTDREGASVNTGPISAVIGRPANAREDRTLVLAASGNAVFEAPSELARGIWQADLNASAADGTVWKHSIRFVVGE